MVIHNGIELEQIPSFPSNFASKDGRIFEYDEGVFRERAYRHEFGYKLVRIRIGEKRVERRVHGLMLEAWVGPKPKGYEGRHLDDDRSNNVLSNLSWGTRAQNSNDRVSNGLKRNSYDRTLKLKIRREHKAGRSMNSLSKKYQVNVGAVHYICKKWDPSK